MKQNNSLNFYSRKLRFNYENIVEFLDLAGIDRYKQFRKSSSVSVRSNRFLFTDPTTLLLLKTPVLSTIDLVRQSVDSDGSILRTSRTTPMTNLLSMKTQSNSDAEIHYKFLEELKESQGSTGYINRNGTINFGVVLAGIHAVICKEHNLRVCELVMNILDLLFGLAVISSSEDEMYKKRLLNDRNNHRKTTSEESNEYIEEWLKQIDTIEDAKYELALDILLR